MPTLLAGLVLGLFGYSFIEYAHHRWGGHTRWSPRLRRSHQAHHQDPREGGVRLVEKYRQRAPLVLLVGVLLGMPIALLLPSALALSTFVGLLTGYAYSEWFHHRMHHARPRSAVARWLWRYHYVHHFVDPTVNHGFTSPLWDLILRTYRPMDHVAIPRKLAPPWTEDVPGFSIRSSRSVAPNHTG